MVGAMVLLIAIVGKYIYAKVTFTSWHFPYSSRTATRLTDSDTTMPVVKRGIYDRWLLFRFTIAFFSLW